MVNVAATVPCGASDAGELLVAEEGAERRAGGTVGLRGVRRRHGEVWGGLRSGVATRWGWRRAALVDDAEEDGQLRRAAGGATELGMRKEKYGDGEGDEADLVEGLVSFFAH